MKLRVGELNSFYGKKHSDKTKEILRIKSSGRKPVNRRQVKIDDFTFDSCADVSKHFNISQGLVTYRLKNKRLYPNWNYI